MVSATDTPRSRRLATREKTGPQNNSATIEHFTSELTKPNHGMKWAEKVNCIAREPTIKLAMTMIRARILLAGFSVKTRDDAPDGAEEFVREQFAKILPCVIDQAVTGTMKHGWAPFEKVAKRIDGGLWGVRKCKQLLHRCTTIRSNQRSGAFDGFLQSADRDQFRLTKIRLRVQDSLNFSTGVEGTNWYGEPILKCVENTFDSMCSVDEAMIRMDSKMSGMHWLVRYPVGCTEVDGEMVENSEIAKGFVRDMQASGEMILPAKVEVRDGSQEYGHSGESDWSVELIEGTGSGCQMLIKRREYLDKQAVRGLGLTERSLLEGKFGTKADAGSHGLMSDAGIILYGGQLLDTFNWHYVNQYLNINYGESAEDSVYFEANPLNDEDKDRLASLYEMFNKDPDIRRREWDNIDKQPLRDAVGVETDESDEDNVFGDENDDFADDDNDFDEVRNDRRRPALLSKFRKRKQEASS